MNINTINRITATDTPKANPSDIPPSMLTWITETFPLNTFPFSVASMYTWTEITVKPTVYNYIIKSHTGDNTSCFWDR